MWGGSEQWFPSMVWRSGPNDTSETLKGSIINFRFESFFFFFFSCLILPEEGMEVIKARLPMAPHERAIRDKL